MQNIADQLSTTTIWVDRESSFRSTTCCTSHEFEAGARYQTRSSHVRTLNPSPPHITGVRKWLCLSYTRHVYLCKKVSQSLLTLIHSMSPRTACLCYRVKMTTSDSFKPPCHYISKLWYPRSQFSYGSRITIATSNMAPQLYYRTESQPNKWKRVRKVYQAPYLPISGHANGALSLP